MIGLGNVCRVDLPEGDPVGWHEIWGSWDMPRDPRKESNPEEIALATMERGPKGASPIPGSPITECLRRIANICQSLGVSQLAINHGR